MLRGIAVSPGVVVAPAFCLDEVLALRPAETLSTSDVPRELARYDEAVEAAAAELRALVEKVSQEIGSRESAIFQSHLLMLRDRAFGSKVKTRIVERQCDCATAIRETLAEYETLFQQIEDEYLRERIIDLRDVVARLQKQLMDDRLQENLDLDEPVILVADDLYPSQTVSFGKLRIAGIVTERGGGTSHAAIIARSMGIPAVAGIPNLRELVRTNDLVALDGREGCLLVNPGPEAEAAFRKLQREFFDFKDYLIENRDQVSVTADGSPIRLCANINNISDATAASEVGASGIGLFRTEYLFMTHPSIPDEEEQYEFYRQMVEASPGRNLTIRTLDLGGDKTVPYLGSSEESNPFMGWRSIRMSFQHPEFFQKQIRAILRAGQHGSVRMMFPMVSTLEELRLLRRTVTRAREALDRENRPYGAVELGIMVEVPGAALCIDQLLPYTDFVSIGTNDLVQYVMAADRDNPKVAHLCEPLNPAVLRLLEHVITACQRQSVPVTVCGEMAGRPRCVLALLAFGLRGFSMSPAFVPIIKELVRSIRLSDLEGVGQAVLKKRSSKLVRNYLEDLLRRLNPRLAQLEFN